MRRKSVGKNQEVWNLKCQIFYLQEALQCLVMVCLMVSFSCQVAACTDAQLLVAMLMYHDIRYQCFSGLNLCSSLLNCYLTVSQSSYTASEGLFVQEDPFWISGVYSQYLVETIWIIYLFLNSAFPKCKALHISANYKIFSLPFKSSNLWLQFNFGCFRDHI